MRIDPQDGTCRSCGGELAVIAADYATMTVECLSLGCQAVYLVEPDAFSDGTMIYYVGFLSGKAPRQTANRADEHS